MFTIHNFVKTPLYFLPKILNNFPDFGQCFSKTFNYFLFFFLKKKEKEKLYFAILSNLRKNFMEITKNNYIIFTQSYYFWIFCHIVFFIVFATHIPINTHTYTHTYIPIRTHTHTHTYTHTDFFWAIWEKIAFIMIITQYFSVYFPRIDFF